MTPTTSPSDSRPGPADAIRSLRALLRVALLDLRGGVRRFTVLMACLALGVGTMAVVGAVGAALQDSLDKDARTLLGGDIEARLTYRAAEPAERALFAGLGQSAEVIDTLARVEFEGTSALAALRGVDAAYPLLGTIELEGQGALQDLLVPRDGVRGAVADPAVLERIGAAVGDTVGIGNAQFEIRGILGRVPDQISDGFTVGAPLIVSTEGIAETGIIEPGGIARYRYKIVLPPGELPDAASARITTGFPGAGWQVAMPGQATEELSRYYALFTRFLAIVGLTALLVGGIGVANAVSSYVNDRQRTIATMKALGATRKRVLAHFLAQIMILVVIGVTIGLVLGAVMTFAGLPAIGPSFGLNVAPTVDWPSLGSAAVFGILIGFACAYLPLHRAEGTKPAILFRTVGTAIPPAPSIAGLFRPGLVLPLAIAAAGVFGMAVLLAGDVALVFWYAVGAVVAFGILALAAEVLKLILKLIRPSSNAPLRNAIKAIVRPGTPAPTVVISLGLGLALLVLITILVDNLRHQLDPSIRVDAPTLVYMDLFEDEAAELQALADADQRIERFNLDPVLRSATLKINGEPPPQTDEMARDISIYFGGEYPLTSAGEMPGGNVIASGEWWPTDYSGPALVSVSEQLRVPLGLKLGDKLTFLIFGDEVGATISSFRKFDWQRGRINFPMILSPGSFDAFPLSYFAFMKIRPGDELQVERQLMDDYPHLTFIPVEEALDVLRNMVDGISTAIAIVGTVAVLSGMLVLAGALAAGRRQREADAVIAKVLGATRVDVVSAYLIEYGLVSGLSAALAIGLGIFGAWAFAVLAVDILFAVDPLLIAVVVGFAFAVTLAIGAATTWRALSTKPARFLREE